MPDQLFNKVFQLEGNARTGIEQLVREFPFFSLSHFYLLKLTGPGDSNYKKIAAKTAIHFNNPFLLYHTLNGIGKNEEGSQNIASDQEVQAKQFVKVEEIELVVPGSKEMQESERENIFQELPVVIELKNAAPEPVETNKEELIFEPLFATDYFASQGIKLSQETQPTDKLGKQLKSFTEWLKTMKKVHDSKLINDNPIDLAVQNLAEKSNEEEEINTESMAEVFIQQGKREKARDVYRKLSLQNPSKSAYFAAKIENLNQQ